MPVSCLCFGGGVGRWNAIAWNAAAKLVTLNLSNNTLYIIITLEYHRSGPQSAPIKQTFSIKREKNGAYRRSESHAGLACYTKSLWFATQIMHSIQKIVQIAKQNGFCSLRTQFWALWTHFWGLRIQFWHLRTHFWRFRLQFLTLRTHFWSLGAQFWPSITRSWCLKSQFLRLRTPLRDLRIQFWALWPQSQGVLAHFWNLLS